MHQIRLTDDQRTALREAAALLTGQAEGLRDSGSANTVAALQGYVQTLETLAAAEESASISAEQKTHVEQAEHILEGVRDGLYNADFEARAEKVDGTIRQLDAIVTEVNTQASHPPPR